MSFRSRPRLSYANVTATIAVFIALGGSAYAAVQIPRNSVGTKQLRKNAVTSLKVKDGTLALRDFKTAEQEKLKGSTGAQGPAGPQGPPGAAGATNVVVRRVDAGPLPGGVFTFVVAKCLPGERATGGGAGFDGNGGNEIIQQSYPGTSTGTEGFRPAVSGEVPTAWVTGIKNANASAFQHTFGYVVCASP